MPPKPRRRKKDEPESLRKAKALLSRHNRRIREESKINIGKSYSKWLEKKELLGIKTHEEFSMFLLNNCTTDTTNIDETLPYGTPGPYRPIKLRSKPGPSKSTPKPKDTDTDENISISSISTSSDVKSSSELSGIGDLRSTRASRKRKILPDFVMYDIKKRRINTSFDFGSSDSPDSDDEGDPDFDPDLEMRLLVEEDKDLEGIKEVAEEEIFLDIKDEEQEPVKERKGTILHEVNIRKGEINPDLPDCAVIHRDSLMLLIKYLTSTPPHRCVRKGCYENVIPSISSRGTSFVVNWNCPVNHSSHRWISQPVLPNGVLLGDLMLASSSLFSGNNFTKIKMLCSFMKLNCISTRTYSYYQTNVLLPCVNSYYEELENEQTEKLMGNPVILGGDGRMDSPGFSAKFCTYTTFDLESGELANMKIVDKRQVGLKSPNMEKKGFELCLDDMLARGVDVKETVTDGHTGIAVLMRTKYPEIFHSLDMWHGAKAIGKKIAKNTNLVRYKPLLPWIKSVVNQFWRAGDGCKNDLNRFIVIWKSVLHHVVNVHEWIFHKCPHGPMEKPTNEKADWLEEGGAAHKKLTEIVMDKYLIGKLKHYTRCRSNAVNESFNSLILMYAAKRYAYDFPAYKARCQLAAIDFIKHSNRPVLKTKEGKVRQHRYFSKGTSEWVVVDVKEPKTYNYIPDLQKAVVIKYCGGNVKISSKLQMAADDPRRISRRIAPVTPPPTEEIVAKKVSRFEKVREGQKKNTN